MSETFTPTPEEIEIPDGADAGDTPDSTPDVTPEAAPDDDDDDQA